MNYLFYAFRNPWHLLAFAVGVIVGFFFNPWVYWPAFLLLDTLFLLSISTHRRFRRYVDALEEAAMAAWQLKLKRQALGSGNRFYREKLRKLDFTLLEIRRNFASHISSPLVKDHSLSALSQLEEHYIRLLYSLMKQRELLEKGGEISFLSEECARLEEEISLTPPHLTEAKQARLEILKKRLSNAIQAQKNCEFIEEQLKMLEESFKLIYEESLQVGDLEVIAHHINKTVSQMHTLSETLREMERLPQLVAADEVVAGKSKF